MASDRKGRKTSNYRTVVVGAIIVIVILVLAINFKQMKAWVTGQPETQTAKLEQHNNLQVATIHVTSDGIEPKNTTLKSYTMLKLIFDVDQDLGKNVKLVSNDLKINADLKSGENTILLDDPQPGTFNFTVESGNITGTITVERSK